MFAKIFATCFADSPRPPVDLSNSAVCLGFGAGLSLAHPTQIFYPAGVNLTFGHGAVGVHGMFSLSRVQQLASGYNANNIYSGDPTNLPTRDTVDRVLPSRSASIPTVAAQLHQGDPHRRSK